MIFWLPHGVSIGNPGLLTQADLDGALRTCPKERIHQIASPTVSVMIIRHEGVTSAECRVPFSLECQCYSSFVRPHNITQLFHTIPYNCVIIVRCCAFGLDSRAKLPNSKTGTVDLCVLFYFGVEAIFFQAFYFDLFFCNFACNPRLGTCAFPPIYYKIPSCEQNQISARIPRVPRMPLQCAPKK